MSTRYDIENRFPDVWLKRAINHLGRQNDRDTLQAISICLAAKAQCARVDIYSALRGGQPLGAR